MFKIKTSFWAFMSILSLATGFVEFAVSQNNGIEPVEGQRDENVPDFYNTLNTTRVGNPGLAVDDEIFKIEMPVFRPIRPLRADYADSKQERNDLLDSFKSIVAVSGLTLSYLDKTVHAGLVAVNQLADNRASHHLLQQISWATHEIARPERKQLYRDFTEKVEYCLGGKDDKKKPDGVNVFLDDEEKQACRNVCGKEPKDIKYLKDYHKDTEEKKSSFNPDQVKGGYAWCVCCAEVTLQTNQPLKGDGSSKEEPKAVSLWDKLIVGNKANGDLKWDATRLRSFYGDILYYAENNSVDKQKIWTEVASASVPRMVYAVRQGLESDKDMHEDAKETLLYAICPRKPTKYCKDFKGIYEALTYIVSGWPPKDLSNMKYADKYLEQWEYASLGKLLYGYDIEAWLAFIPPKSRPTPGSNDFDIDKPAYETLKALLVSYADASATAFVRTMHIRYKARVEDFMAFSNVLSDYEKNKIRSLMARVDRQFEVMDAQANVERFVENKNIIAGITQEKDRALAVSTLLQAMSATIATDRGHYTGGAVVNEGAGQK